VATGGVQHDRLGWCARQGGIHQLHGFGRGLAGGNLVNGIRQGARLGLGDRCCIHSVVPRPSDRRRGCGVLKSEPAIERNGDALALALEGLYIVQDPRREQDELSRLELHMPNVVGERTP
jgi:hypothetical protein